jgi:hypothetical protein
MISHLLGKGPVFPIRPNIRKLLKNGVSRWASFSCVEVTHSERYTFHKFCGATIRQDNVMVRGATVKQNNGSRKYKQGCKKFFTFVSFKAISLKINSHTTDLAYRHSKSNVPPTYCTHIPRHDANNSLDCLAFPQRNYHFSLAMCRKQKTLARFQYSLAGNWVTVEIR